uniref:Phloem protein 2 n=1 Tax=Leersia perrieri TaxID=77586 RepID=A0A0D9UX05_9ORYZ
MGASSSRQASNSSSRSSYVGNSNAVVVSRSTANLSDSNQAQSKRAPAPHMLQEIVAGEKGANASELEGQVHAGIFLASKTKKYWVDERTRYNYFMLFPRGLSITWSEDPKFWTWHPLKEESDADTQIEVVSLQNVCWLEINGKIELSHLTPGVTYKVVFEVMLTDPAYGWSVPVNLQLKFPDGTVQQHKENLQEKIRWKWLELKVGEVKTQQGQKGDIEISMFEYDGGNWKRGLVIKGIKILPKH